MNWIGRMIFGSKQEPEEDVESSEEQEEDDDEEVEEERATPLPKFDNTHEITSTMSRMQIDSDEKKWGEEVHPEHNDFDIDEEDDEEDVNSYEPPKSATRQSIPRQSAGRSTIRRTSGRKSTGNRMNDNLTAGIVHNRTYVGRGSEIGVFKHDSEGMLQYLTRIQAVKNVKGEEFTPSKMMLHQGDERLLMLNSSEPGKVYEMDLERGKVINEFRAKEDLQIRSIGGISKYAEKTQESTMLGVSDRALFTIDPRISGANKVAKEKVYSTNVKMSSLSATGEGKVAVASDQGEIRLFNDITKNAKTCLLGYGDPIVGLDVTENGRWIAATTKTYILLINTVPVEGAKSGFDQSITKTAEKPIKLQLHPEDIAKYEIEAVSFTPAKFNIGDNIDEQWLISSTGPYLVMWNFGRIKSNPDKYMYDYKIKLCTQDVVADQFLFGYDNQVVVTLPEQVYVQKRS